MTGTHAENSSQTPNRNTTPATGSRHTATAGRPFSHEHGNNDNIQDGAVASETHAAHKVKEEDVIFDKMRRTKSSQPALEQNTPQWTSGEDVAGHRIAETDRPRPQSMKRSQTQIQSLQRTHSPIGASTSPAHILESGTDGKHAIEAPRVEETDSIAKEKKKGVSFLSRFIGTKKKVPSDEVADHESVQSESRPEGMDARLYDGIEFNPKHPQPPPYIKVRSRYKKEKEFDRVFLAQELKVGVALAQPLRKSNNNFASSTGAPSQADAEDTIWALEFSKDGRYLASGGQDKVVRLWAVISTPEERRQHEGQEQQARHGDRPLRVSAAVFQSSVYRQYEGHEGAVIDLSWSKNNFLLSASADKTVRLWHVSRAECLCTFKHTEHVLSVQFHPRDDRFFLAGSRDMKLRLWSIPDKGVAFWKQCPEVVTAVAFTPDGKTAIAGTVNGICHFYETEGLKYQTQMHVRSAHGKNAKGSKISSIQTVSVSPDTDGGDVKLLISSNDSRIRLYNLRDKSLEMKFKGHKAEERSIHSTFSDDARYVVCGSEDKGAYIYSTCPPETDKLNQHPMEFFEASTTKTTWTILSPKNTRFLLSQSEDPIYELCNPPPVTLLSRSESAVSSRPATESGSVQAVTDSPFKRASETPAYLARCAHQDGQIIITASNTGIMRVYRQDCAFTKRKSNDDSASVFGKKASSIYMARAMSRSSPSAGRTGRSDSTGTQPPQDRILSWRQAISSTQSLDRTGLRNASDAKSSTRSVSPSKSGLSKRQDSSAQAYAFAQAQAQARSGVNDGSPSRMAKNKSDAEFGLTSTSTNNTTTNAATAAATTTTTTTPTPTMTMTRNHNDMDDESTSLVTDAHKNSLWSQPDQSFVAWNPFHYKSQALQSGTDASHLMSRSGENGGDGGNTLQRPRLESALSGVSQLSSELNSNDPDDDPDDDEDEGESDARRGMRSRGNGGGGGGDRAAAKEFR